MGKCNLQARLYAELVYLKKIVRRNLVIRRPIFTTSSRGIFFRRDEELALPCICKRKHKSTPGNSLKLSIRERGMYEYRGGCSNEVI